MVDDIGLERFTRAQAGVYERALDEIRSGAKRSHWMWFVFPQLAGLGSSAMAVRYAIAGIEEARAYLQHPVLGERLREIVMALGNIEPADAVRVFGPIDAMKLRSSLTLFARADGGPDGPFHAALTRWFDGAEDPATIERL